MTETRRNINRFWQVAVSSTAYAVILSNHVRSVQAYPAGAGSCFGGMPAVGNSHVIRTSDYGLLSQFGLALTLDGEPLDSSGKATNFTLGDSHSLVVAGSKGYRGILYRLSPLNTDDSGIDTTAALAPVGSNLQDAGFVCTEPNVVGVTHIDRSYKTSTEASLQMDTAGALALDVTVVVENSLDAGSEYYYERFLLSAGSGINDENADIIGSGNNNENEDLAVIGESNSTGTTDDTSTRDTTDTDLTTAGATVPETSGSKRTMLATTSSVIAGVVAGRAVLSFF